MANLKHAPQIIIIYLSNADFLSKMLWQQIYKGQLKIRGYQEIIFIQ